jgi:hypothetical protein
MITHRMDSQQVLYASDAHMALLAQDYRLAAVYCRHGQEWVRMEKEVEVTPRRWQEDNE